MKRFDKLSRELLDKSVFHQKSSLDKNIAWRLSDIVNGIDELTSKDFKIGAINMCFTWPDGKGYQPMWGDCLMLGEDNNSDYRKLFEGLPTQDSVNIDTVMELIKRFDMIFTKDLNNPLDFAEEKELIKEELKSFDLDKMFFSLYIERE
jgi:hypothetical protein